MSLLAKETVKRTLQDFKVIQWLRLRAPNIEGLGSIPGGETKSHHSTWCDQKKKKQNIYIYIVIFLRLIINSEANVRSELEECV